MSPKSNVLGTSAGDNRDGFIKTVEDDEVAVLLDVPRDGGADCRAFVVIIDFSKISSYHM